MGESSLANVMKEIEVLTRVVDHLNDTGCTFFIDSGYGDEEIKDIAESYENCGVNNTITVGTRIPDIIGFSPQESLIAFEVKGRKDLRKGIGQAAYYRRAVHESYLAADSTKLSEFKDTAISCGLGVYSVTRHGGIEIDRPPRNITASEARATQRALGIKIAKFESSDDIFPSMSRPINSLLPVAAIGSMGDNWTLERSRCEAIITESDQGYSQPADAIRLAKTLDLIREPASRSHRLQLTDIGRASFYLMTGLHESMMIGGQGSTVDLLFDFIDEVKSGSRDPLYVNYPETAAFLRDRFLSVPDVRLLSQVLAGYSGSEGELSRVLSEIALASPDAFLNLFCSRGKEIEFRNLIEDHHRNVSSNSFRQSLLDLTSSNALYNFVYNIRHIGILTKKSDAVHQKGNLVVDKYRWYWDKEVITTEGADMF